MAGKQKGRKNTQIKAKSTKQADRSSRRRIAPANTNENRNVQIDSARPGTSNESNNPTQLFQSNVTRGRARILEDNAIVEMSAEGQETDFGDSVSQSDSMDSGEDQPITGVRNESNRINAVSNVLDGDRNRPAAFLEDGECEDDSANLNRPPSAKRPRGQGQPQGAECDLDLRSYVDQKFSALAKMVELERELSEKNRELDLLKAKGNASYSVGAPVNNVIDKQIENNSHSEITIYRNAVEKSKRGSSSSEEMINTSDEIDDREIVGEFQQQPGGDINENERNEFYFPEKEMQKAKQMEKDHRRHSDNDRDRRGGRYESRPGTSYQGNYRYDDDYRSPQQPKRDFVGEKSKKLINEAENAKARIYEVPGEFEEWELMQDDREHEKMISNFRKRVSTAEMDEDYRMVAAHIDHRTKMQVLNHEYVDFSKLLPKSKLGFQEEDQQFMQIVNRGGTAGFMTVSDRGSVISSYNKWEQAFRVFCDIYTSRYPSRATELIQYNHTIHMASQSYVWDNVYMYDIEVRKHMTNHPSRNWGIILNMAWTICIKDRHHGQFGKFQSRGISNNSKPAPSEMKQRKPCIDFNKGKCTYGGRCKFDHHCGTCSKFGHGTHICRKAIQDGDKVKDVKKESS